MLQLQLVVAKSILFYIISSENETEWTVRFTGIFCSIYKHHPRLARQIHFWGKTCSDVRRQTYVTPAVTWPKQKQRAHAGSAGKTTGTEIALLFQVVSSLCSSRQCTTIDPSGQTKETPTVNIWTSSQNSGGQTGEWALVQEEQMGPLLTPGKISLNR